MRLFLENVIVMILVGYIEHILHMWILVASLMEILCSCPKLLSSALATRVGRFNNRWGSSLTCLWQLFLGSGLVAIDRWECQTTLLSCVWLTLGRIE